MNETLTLNARERLSFGEPTEVILMDLLLELEMMKPKKR